jgi:hypothetical protein
MNSSHPNILFSYCYRDYANYKQHNDIIFANPDGLAIDQVDKIIRSKLIDGEWFYASDWEVNDLHFEDWDLEIDHPLHEFKEVSLTELSPNASIAIDAFLRAVLSSDGKFKV